MGYRSDNVNYSPLRYLGFYLVLGLYVALTVHSFAQASSSANFQVRDDQLNGSGGSQSSSNFTIYGSVEPLVNLQSSGNFQQQSGSPIRVDANQPNTGGGTSGSTSPTPRPGCPVPGNITVSGLTCNRAYKSLIKISGTRDRNTPYIFVNDDLAGTVLPTSTTWSRDVYLRPGTNTLVVYGKNSCDAQTPPVTVNIQKARMGDTNDDNQTNDYDLSAFARRWEKRNDCISDFNRDQVTNDYDLSLLASSWNG